MSILIYYVILFIVLQSVINAQAYYSTEDYALSVVDPGFQSKDPQFLETAQCIGKNNRNIAWNGDIICKRLDLPSEVPCNDLNGCIWKNASFLFVFNTSGCIGDVNKTFYGINESVTFKTLCTDPVILFNESLCGVLGCTWLNYSEVVDLNYEIEQDNNAMDIIETVMFVAKFRADFGLPGAFNWIVTFIMLFIPVIMLFLAIYFASPFAH